MAGRPGAKRIIDPTTGKRSYAAATISASPIMDRKKPSDAEEKFKPKPGLIIKPQLWIGQLGIPARSDDPFTPRNGQETRKYFDIARHPEVKAALTWRVKGCFSTPLDIRGRNDYERHPEFEPLDSMYIQSCLDQIARFAYPFHFCLQACLYNALVAGFPFPEFQWGRRDGANVLQNIRSHSPFNVTYWVSDIGDVQQIWWKGLPLPAGPELASFPRAPYPYLLNDNHYGTSELQSVLHDVLLLQEIEKLQALGIRYVCVRPIIHEYTERAKAANKNGEDAELENEVDSIRAALLELDSASVLSVLQDREQSGEGKVSEVPRHKFTVMDSRADADGIKYIQDVIVALRQRINRTLGRPDNTGFTDTSVAGSYAKARVEEKSELAVNVADAEWVASFVTDHVIPAMLEYNYTFPDGYLLPEAYFHAKEEEWQDDKAAMFVQLLEGKVLDPRLDNQMIRDQLDLGTTPPEMLQPAPPEGALGKAYELVALQKGGFIQPTLEDVNEVRRLTGIAELPPGTQLTFPPNIVAPPSSPAQQEMFPA